MKQWKKSLLYTPKHTKPTDKNLMRLFLPSIVGILICMVCLAGTTWAWFSASVQTGAQTITAANFNVKVAIDPTPVESADGRYKLTGNVTYTVTLKATGTADEFGGYCIVENTAGDKHYTSQMKPGDSLKFTLIPPADGTYTFTAVWGKYSGVADISAGGVIGQEQTSGSGTEPSEPPTEDTASTEPVYVVQSGDTLSNIASQYGTTAAKAAAYNGVESPDSLQIRQKIKTSPADYDIPTEPSASSTPSKSTESVGSSEETVPSVDTVESKPTPTEPFPLQSPPMEEPTAEN